MGHKKRTRLLFIAATDSLRAGGEISHLELVRGAIKRGYTVHMVLPAQGELARYLRRSEIPYSIIPYTWWDSNVLAEKSGPVNTIAIHLMSRLIEEQKIDCVITNTLNIPWGALAAACTDVPHIWIAREFVLNEFSYLQDRLDFIGKFSNLILANSKQVAKYIKQSIKESPVKYFYSFVNQEQLALGATMDEPRIVNIAHIQERKNQLELIKAMGILQEKYGLKPEVLLIGGFSEKDKYYQRLKAEIKKQGLDNIKVIGYRAEPFRLMGLNDIFLQVSQSESVGRTTVEAMKLGLVCVGRDIPGTREAFQFGGGTLYKSGDPYDLARNINSILTNPKTAKQKSQQAQIKVLQNLSEQACHDPFFTALNKVIGVNNPRGELRHIAPYIAGAAEELSNINNTIQMYEKTIKKYDRDIANIVNSRSWKTILKMRKILYRR